MAKCRSIPRTSAATVPVSLLRGDPSLADPTKRSGRYAPLGFRTLAAQVHAPVPVRPQERPGRGLDWHPGPA